MMSLTVTGMERMQAAVAETERKVAENAMRSVAAMAADAARRMREAMLSASSPSPPGSPPGIVTGNLLKGVYSSHTPGTFVAEAGINAPHWHFAEYGTRKQAARPVIRPSAMAAAQEGERVIVSGMRATFGGL